MTTLEMDGIFTDEDIKNRYSVVFQCKLCRRWTRHDNYLPGEHNTFRPCSNCGETAYDRASVKSFRTYNPLSDIKRKPK